MYCSPYIVISVLPRWTQSVALGRDMDSGGKSIYYIDRSRALYIVY